MTSCEFWPIPVRTGLALQPRRARTFMIWSRSSGSSLGASSAASSGTGRSLKGIARMKNTERCRGGEDTTKECSRLDNGEKRQEIKST